MTYFVQAALAFMTAITTYFSAPLILDKTKPPVVETDGETCSENFKEAV
ncbi:MAG: hypothetical protein FWC70_03985 [Defluviitaleaceae bacterium]|nr:hypothetical protein [Defluviitaleaceae bacterium]